MSDAKRYRLPEALGGGEYEEHRRADGSTEAPMGTVAFLENGALVCVARVLLTEVKPPMPPEPPVGSFVHLASYYGVYERVDRGWISANDAAAEVYEWDTLLRLNSGDTPVQLVPYPFAEPVELPWRLAIADLNPFNWSAMVACSIRPDRAACVTASAYLTADEARAMARALWTTADAAEATS